MEFRGTRIMQRVQVFRNLNTPALLGIDAIDNLGITYLSRKKEFYFQNALLAKSNRYEKADLQTVHSMTIPAHTSCPMRFGTSIGRRHTPMAAGFKSVSTIASMEFPMIFAQPGLVIPDHQGDVTLLIQNCSDQDVEIPRCTTLGFIENLKNTEFKEIHEINQEQLKKSWSKDKPLPTAMPTDKKVEFLKC